MPVCEGQPASQSLADNPIEWSRSEERRTAGVAPRACGAATPSDAAAARLGRPGGAGRTRTAAPTSGVAGLVRAAGDAAALASRPGAAPLDLPAPARPPDGDSRASGVGGAAGQGEPDLGIPPHPRRAAPARVQARGEHRVDHPAPRRCRSSADAFGDDLAAVPPRRPPVCWRWTSSPWTRCGCSGCTCCS